MILVSTDKLQIVLGGAVTTNQLQWSTAWADHTTTTFSPDSDTGLTNDTTDVDIVGVPPGSTQRQIKSISIFNSDTVNSVVIVKIDVSGTDRVLVRKTLAPNQNLTWTQETGWNVFPNADTSIVDTDDVPEGLTNRYFTSLRATQAVSAKLTSVNTRLVNLSATLENRLSAVSTLAGSGGYNDALISARITSVNENVVSAYGRINTLSVRVVSVNENVTSALSRIGVVSGKLTSVNTRLVNLSATLENRLSTVSTLAAAGGYNDALISARITSVNENVTSALTKIAMVSGRITSVNENVVSAYSRINTVSSKLTSVNENVVSAYGRINTLSVRVVSVNENTTSALNRIGVVSGKLTSVNTRLVNLSATLENRLSAVSALAGSGGYNDALISARIISVNENVVSAYGRINTLSVRVVSVNENVVSALGKINSLSISNEKTSTFVISNRTRYPVNTTSAVITIYLPLGQPNKTYVGFYDARGTWATNNFVIRSSINNLIGTSVLECDLNNRGIEMVYTSLTGWRLVND